MQESRGLKGLLMGQLDSRSTDAGTRVLATADNLRKIAGEMQNDELSRGAASLATRGADSLERIGEYLKQSNGHRLVTDAEQFGRTRPWAVATSGFLLGLAGSRMLKASALRRSMPESGDYGYSTSSSYAAPTSYGAGQTIAGTPAPYGSAPGSVETNGGMSSASGMQGFGNGGGVEGTNSYGASGGTKMKGSGYSVTPPGSSTSPLGSDLHDGLDAGLGDRERP